VDVVNLKPSRIGFIGSYFLGFILFIGLIAYDFVFTIPSLWKYVLLFLVSLIFLEPEFVIFITDYKLDSEKVTEIKGLIAKKKTSIPYRNISQIVMKKGIVGRLFDFGNITLISSAGPQNIIVLRSLRHPEKYLEMIEKKR
jgi:uncharacterized membrane protein YdbT with pleckstrin-like domain